MTIEVISAGAQTTVQDAGRLGFYHDGVAPAGPQDAYAFRLANLIAGNGFTPALFSQSVDRGAAGLEMTMQGPRLRFQRAARIAITGADMRPSVNGAPVPMWTRLEIAMGSLLEFRVASTGLRSYLAIAGGLDLPLDLESRATCLVARIGGMNGRVLQAGDRLDIGEAAALSGQFTLAEEFRPVFTVEPVLHVLPGPQDHLFRVESVAAFFGNPWKMSPVSNRMGFRFDGPELFFNDRSSEVIRDSGSDPSNIVDDVIPSGGIQIAGGKQAIVMGVEAPSVGGYAKIGTVISADFGVLGQVKPGQSVRFVKVSQAQAEEARIAMESRLARAAASLGIEWPNRERGRA